MTRPDKHAARFGLKYTCRGTPRARLPIGYTTDQAFAVVRQISEIYRKLGAMARRGDYVRRA